ncbi:hypothetical protein SAMN05192553_10999 [Cyclobacterium xiamenense]|uniref:Uncharacterized protein n=1 Tax=Cyclobacterium xiamenense TaxID=1297121 RepID=A0A1H7B638_9BACT|nr:hypothetical protein [Cyclobacterium xiamenense]SEJ71717.1 hypothetical protein SAMN05192553_10999 [Cyclobacterium xiamenense]
MATANPKLILALRKTISKLKKGAPYQWGHMGACNCGNLAQEITRISKSDIHRFAMQRSGDWSEQLNDYCPSSGLPMDLMISELLGIGLSREDLIHLERLSDPEILALIPMDQRMHLVKNKKEDLLLYLETWVRQLENEWAENQRTTLPSGGKKIIPTEVLS